MTASTPTAVHRFPYIDIARAIAICLVIANHVGMRIEHRSLLTKIICDYSQVGVQLFFVASALTLCISTSTRQTTFWQFAIRRFFRIAPAFYLGIFVYLGWRLIKDHYMQQSTAEPDIFEFKNIAESFLFLQTVIPGSSSLVVPGSWSISAEMLFYFCFPFLFRRTLAGGKQHRILVLLILLDANLLVQHVVPWIGFAAIEKDTFLYFFITNQLPVFALGIALFGWIESAKNWRHPLVTFLGITAVTLLAWRSNIPFIFAVTPTLAGCSFFFLILFLRGAEIPTSIRLSLSSVGRVSFSMYLLHFIVIDCLVYILHRSSTIFQNIFDDLQVWIIFSATILITYGLATVSYMYIEELGIAIGVKFESKLLPFMSSSAQLSRRFKK